MAEGKRVNWTAIILTLLGLIVASVLVYVFSLGGEQPRAGATGDEPGQPPAAPAFEKPDSEVLVTSVTNNTVVGFAIDTSTGQLIDPATPSRVVGGALNPGAWVGVRAPFGIAVDSGGKFFVANQGDGASPPSVTLFKADADGATAAYDIHAGAATQLVKPQGVALRRNPRSLLVGNWVDPPVAGLASGVLEFSTQSGATAPTGNIAGSNTTIATPMGIAIDVSTKVYVVDSASDRILVFQPQPGTNSNGTPIAIIAGDQTLLDRPAHIAVDGQGNVFVSNQRGNKSKPGYITVYGPNPNGNVAPTRVIGVPGGSLGSTQLRRPFGVAVHALGTLFVTEDDELLVFAANAVNNDAPIQRSIYNGLDYVTAIAVRDP